MELGNVNALWLLFFVPVVLVPAYVWCFWRKARMLRLLASVQMLKKITPSVSLGRQMFKAFLVLAAFVSIVIGLTEPKWNPQPQRIKRKGRDIVVLLDTSRSMLAEDIRPSRLERSKIAIVTFAGNASVKCPLTQDYAFVRLVLSDVTTESSSRGGTMIGDAIRKAVTDVFDRQSREYKDVVLITDGEEHEGSESFAEQAAARAAEEGARIIAIGLGDEAEGSRVPITGPDGEKTFLKYWGREVWSKLGGDLLRSIVYATPGGKFLAVEPGQTFDLGEIYESQIASAEKRELESVTMTRYDEKFQIFIALAIGLLVCEVFISETKKE
jgi:Ca-activated chloride channel family protein